MNYPVRVAIWNGRCGASHRLYTFTIEGVLCAYLRQTKTDNQINKEKEL